MSFIDLSSTKYIVVVNTAFSFRGERSNTGFLNVFGKEKASNKHNPRASVLIESLLAVVILSVSVSFVISAMTASLRASRNSSFYTEALFLMENKMAQLMEKRTINSGLNEEGSFSEFNRRYKYILTAEPVITDAETRLNYVRLTVLWESAVKKNSLTTETYLFQPQ